MKKLHQMERKKYDKRLKKLNIFKPIKIIIMHNFTSKVV